jgi:hypothetical protein
MEGRMAAGSTGLFAAAVENPVAAVRSLHRIDLHAIHLHTEVQMVAAKPVDPLWPS